MSTEKRKRSANFSDDEKMRFLRILQKKGKVIITKTTSHDMQTNRLKEEAWTQITNELNACGNIMRTPANLKKLWQKLKTEAKTFKETAYNQAIGTGGGPSKKTDDPVLELLAEITSHARATTGIESVDDCDSRMSYTDTKLDSKKKSIFRRTSAPTPFEPQQDVDSQCGSEDTKNNMIPVHASSGGVAPIGVQRSDSSQSVAYEDVLEVLHNNLAGERLRCETEKISLIALQKEHMLELHALKIENIKTQAALKASILEAILKTIQDGQPLDPELVKFALCNNE